MTLIALCSNDPESPNRDSVRTKKQKGFVPTEGDRMYSIICKGMSPLLMAKWDEHEMCRCPLSRRFLQSTLDHCERSIYRNAEGYPILQEDHLTACMRAASRSIKIKRQPLFGCGCQMESVMGVVTEEIRLKFPSGKNPLSKYPSVKREDVEQDDPDSPWCLHVTHGGEPSVCKIIRPMFEQWSFTFKIRARLSWIEYIGGIETLRLLLTRAGKRVGLLSYRPACNGPYGRFTVESIEEIPTEKS